jgi:hypothetical protein
LFEVGKRRAVAVDDLCCLQIEPRGKEGARVEEDPLFKPPIGVSMSRKFLSKENRAKRGLLWGSMKPTSG